MLKQTIKPIRGAIYKRKFTEEGLEQEFNSLDDKKKQAKALLKLIVMKVGN
ncbi:hypothetical protein [Bartonella sp. AC67GZZY]|uniref:hypothetical protein n=1 Tax=Bartonella sp. AC67GZZY TaxID=3243459 RepID=UPI0035D08FD1